MNTRTAGVDSGALDSAVFDTTCVIILSLLSLRSDPSIYFDSEVAANDILERLGPME